MFHIILSCVVAVIIATFSILKFTCCKNSEKFSRITNRILKISVVVYASLMILSLLLPDAFKLCYSQEDLARMDINTGYVIIRWLSIVNFIVLPIAVFYKNRTIRNIAIFYGVAITIASLFFYNEYMADFTSALGRGLNSISVLSQGFKDFLINHAFRSIWFGIILTLQLCIPIVLAINEKHMFNFKDKREYLNFFLTLPFISFCALPIYVPQFLFGYTNLIFEAFGIVHFGWLFLVICTLVALYYIFKNKDTDTKMVLLFVLSLSLVMQYTQMFSAISINLYRLPLQLCNICAFLILVSLITRNKRIFNFTVIINVVGVIFAMAMPNLDGEGLFYLYNMHFIFEHTNVLIVPVLALLFKIFPRLDKYALRDCLIGFTIYFIIVLLLGSWFNAIKVRTGNDFYEANYMFMLVPDEAVALLPFTQKLFDINFHIGNAVFYPVLQLIVYLVFVAVCVILFFVIQLIYKISDKFAKPMTTDTSQIK